MDGCCAEADRRAVAALGELYDEDADARYRDRQVEAARIEESLGESWHGREFWYVATELQILPSVLAREWSPDEVFEAYLYLRLRYLREGPGGV